MLIQLPDLQLKINKNESNNELIQSQNYVNLIKKYKIIVFIKF